MLKTKNKHLIVILAISILAGVGAWLTFLSGAAASNELNLGNVTAQNRPQQHLGTVRPHNNLINVYADLTREIRPDPSIQRLTFAVRTSPPGPKNIPGIPKLTYFECAPNNECYSNRIRKQTISVDDAGSNVYFIVCIALKPQDHKSRFYLGSIRVADDSPLSDLTLETIYAEGLPVNNPPVTECAGGHVPTQFGASTHDMISLGPGTKDAVGNNGTGGTGSGGSGSGGSGSGSSGSSAGNGRSSGSGSGNSSNSSSSTSSSSGGSSAIRQGDSDSSVPSSSGQGDVVVDQDVVPDPFYDGRQYDSGSEEDTLSGNIRRTSGQLIKRWYFVVPAVIAIGAAIGFSYWYSKRRGSA